MSPALMNEQKEGTGHRERGGKERRRSSVDIVGFCRDKVNREYVRGGLLKAFVQSYCPLLKRDN